jgi:hypothetical protein
LALLLASCRSAKKQYITIDLNSTCTPISYFDTLATVLLTNDPSDLGGESGRLENFFAGKRVYKKNLLKSGGHFYIDSVAKKEYFYFVVVAKLFGAGYLGYTRKVNFSDVNSDTLKFDLCITAGMRPDK